ncbi:Peptide methionine sulfoxide reductase MsrA [Acaryochloris thomasi RCC1774]|uniref:Peptide methionine sulfoxide reductase MsrA n=1 Tax=Acaryochloris thomasi RCC1774 TaxID=1764569 RepID=A0A2W1JRX4_9CYAN|nr:peptide-methionine (S)-S-oxide reductase MsrA [Acaryochloris thomasi]PZD71811.1 Peptide methionine sulfoxide reductase MsrA [Acaryochloris thomasi RCC1774]
MFKRWFAIATLTLFFALYTWMPAVYAQDQAKAIFAGGCFWCMEKPFDELPGVISTTSGYTGGTKDNPTYEEVSSGNTGHAESVEVVYDPEQVSYDQLLDVYWHNVDPVDGGGQFCDRGSQYRPSIFYTSDDQKALAEQSKQTLEKSGQLPKPIQTTIVSASEFYPAEDYHQNYYETNSTWYHFYRFTCGRDQRLAKLWKQDNA